MINWHTSNDYIADRYRFVKYAEEGSLNPRLTPYNDRAGPGAAGFITIGVGFNLEDEAVGTAVFTQFGLIYDNPALSDQPTAPGQPSPREIENEYITELFANIIGSADPEVELNRIMADRAANPHLTALTNRRPTFAFYDDAEVKVVFDKLMTDIYEPKLNRWYSGSNTQQDIPNGPERIVLLSLAYNGIIAPGKSQNLLQALKSEDRAEAWFEIRYNSNSSGQRLNIRQGLAKRRYYEADTFGLYDQATPANDRDAKGALRVYTRHREKIDLYDVEYGQQIPLANSTYNTTVVQSRADWFAPARAYLRTNYFATVSAAALDGDILVGENDGSDGGVDTRYYRNGRANDDIDFDLRGGANNDLIFGESGNDHVNGGAGQDVIYGGAGRDMITGGAGNDYLEGGTGDDIYYLNAGDGQDQIKDQDGANLVVFEGVPLRSLVRAVGETNYRSPDGRFTAVMQGTALLVTDTQGGASVLLSDFAAERFGIQLTDIAAIPPTSTYAPITNVTTSPNLNTYTGTAAAETTNGSAINDDIFGFGGGDYLLGGAGADRIEAGSGALGAIIDGGFGRDVIIGGNGNDRLIGGPATDTGANEDDAIQGGGGDDYIEGGWGDDVLAGGAGHDILVGGEGHDVIHSASPMIALNRTWDIITWPDPPGRRDPVLGVRRRSL